jgi:CBS domain-containing protein
MIEKTLTLTPDQTVGEALRMFKEHNIRNVPVIDANGKFLGLFGLKEVLKNILPAAVDMGKGLTNMEFIVGGAGNVAKKLKKSHDLKVGDTLKKEAGVIHPDSTTWEALRVMVKHGSPVPVVEEKTFKFVGLISRQSLLTELERMSDDIESGKYEDEIDD